MYVYSTVVWVFSRLKLKMVNVVGKPHGFWLGPLYWDAQTKDTTAAIHHPRTGLQPYHPLVSWLERLEVRKLRKWFEGDSSGNWWTCWWNSSIYLMQYIKVSSMELWVVHLGRKKENISMVVFYFTMSVSPLITIRLWFHSCSKCLD